MKKDKYYIMNLDNPVVLFRINSVGVIHSCSIVGIWQEMSWSIEELERGDGSRMIPKREAMNLFPKAFV